MNMNSAPLIYLQPTVTTNIFDSLLSQIKLPPQSFQMNSFYTENTPCLHITFCTFHMQLQLQARHLIPVTFPPCYNMYWSPAELKCILQNTIYKLKAQLHL